MARKTQSVSEIKIERVFREDPEPHEAERIWHRLVELLAGGGE